MHLTVDCCTVTLCLSYMHLDDHSGSNVTNLLLCCSCVSVYFLECFLFVCFTVLCFMYVYAVYFSCILFFCAALHGVIKNDNIKYVTCNNWSTRSKGWTHVILFVIVLSQYTRVTDRQTDVRQTTDNILWQKRNFAIFRFCHRMLSVAFYLKFALKVTHPLWKTPTSTNICL